MTEEESSAVAKVRVHLNAGTAIDTLVYEDELESFDNLGDLIESLVNQGPGRPQWVNLGDVAFHPQSVAAIAVIDEYEQEAA